MSLAHHGALAIIVLAIMVRAIMVHDIVSKIHPPPPHLSLTAFSMPECIQKVLPR